MLYYEQYDWHLICNDQDKIDKMMRIMDNLIYDMTIKSYDCSRIHVKELYKVVITNTNINYISVWHNVDMQDIEKWWFCFDDLPLIREFGWRIDIVFDQDQMYKANL